MLLFRSLGKLLLVLGFLALAYDGVRMLATPAEGLIFTSLESFFKNSWPSLKQTLHDGVIAHAPSFVWTYCVEPLLFLPTSLVMGGLGCALFLLGYRRGGLRISED